MPTSGSSSFATERDSLRWVQPRESVATIVYTSGTTGSAKGAVLTHGNLLAMVGDQAPRAGQLEFDGTKYQVTRTTRCECPYKDANLLVDRARWKSHDPACPRVTE